MHIVIEADPPRKLPVHLENENALVAEARAGSGEAFATLFNQYDKRLFRLALNITANQQDAARRVTVEAERAES